MTTLHATFAILIWLALLAALVLWRTYITRKRIPVPLTEEDCCSDYYERRGR